MEPKTVPSAALADGGPHSSLPLSMGLQALRVPLRGQERPWASSVETELRPP